jgi:hypothetical protein
MAVSALFTAARPTPDLAPVLTRIGCEANSGPQVDGEIDAEVSGCHRRALAYSLWLAMRQSLIYTNGIIEW